MEVILNFLLQYLKGIAIGSGAILPGISSGVLCVIFGIYDILVNTVLTFFKDFKKNFLFLLPIVLGAFSGIILFGNILNILIVKYPIPTKMCFIGLILGTLPSLFKQANNNKGFRLHYLLYLFIAFGLAIFLIFLEQHLNLTFSTCPGFMYLVLAGFMMSIGVVFPGVSSTVILMLFGVYSFYLEAVSFLQFSILIPMGIGLVLGGIIFLLLIRYLLNNFYSATYYSIIGFVIGSIFILIPNHFSCCNIQSILGCILRNYKFYYRQKVSKLNKDWFLLFI